MKILRRLFPVFCLLANEIYNYQKTDEEDFKLLKLILNAAFLIVFMNKAENYYAKLNEKQEVSDLWWLLLYINRIRVFIGLMVFKIIAYLGVLQTLKLVCYLSLARFDMVKRFAKAQFSGYYNSNYRKRRKLALKLLLATVACCVDKSWYARAMLLMVISVKSKQAVLGLIQLLLPLAAIVVEYPEGFCCKLVVYLGIAATLHKCNNQEKTAVCLYLFLGAYYSRVDTFDILFGAQLVIFYAVAIKKRGPICLQYLYALQQQLLVSTVFFLAIRTDDMLLYLKSFTYILVIGLMHTMSNFKWLDTAFGLDIYQLGRDLVIKAQIEQTVQFFKVIGIFYVIFMLRTFDFISALVYSVYIDINGCNPIVLLTMIFLQYFINYMSLFSKAAVYLTADRKPHFSVVKRYHFSISERVYSSASDLVMCNKLGLLFLSVQIVLFSLLISSASREDRKLLKISRVT